MSYNSTSGYGSVSNPGSGGTITSVAGLVKGNYTIVVSTGISGTGAPADSNNMQLQVDGGSVATLMATYGGAARAVSPAICHSVGSGGTVQVVTAGTSTTTAVYSAQIVATPYALFE